MIFSTKELFSSAVSVVVIVAVLWVQGLIVQSESHPEAERRSHCCRPAWGNQRLENLTFCVLASVAVSVHTNRLFSEGS